MFQRGLISDAGEGAVFRAQVGHREHSLRADVDLGVATRDEGVVREVEVIAFSTKGDAVTARAHDEANLAPAQPLDDAHLGGPLGAGVEVRSFGIGLRPEIGRQGFDLEELFAHQKHRAGFQPHGSADAQEHAVDGAFVAHEQLVIPVEEVGVARGHQGVLGKQDGPFAAAHNMLGPAELVGQTVSAVGLDHHQLGHASRLNAEKNMVLPELELGAGGISMRVPHWPQK